MGLMSGIDSPKNIRVSRLARKLLSRIREYERRLSASEKWQWYVKLLSNLRYLTTMNLVHLDSYAITPQGKHEVSKWVKYLIESGKNLNSINVMDQGQMQRNLPEVLRWVYDTLPKVQQVFQKYLPPDKIPPTVQTAIDLYVKIVSSN